MAEKLIVEKVYEDDDIPVGDCQIYTISSPSDNTPICSVESEGLAHAFAAAELMLETLEDLVGQLREGRKGREVPEWLHNLDLAPAKAAIAAAKGE